MKANNANPVQAIALSSDRARFGQDPATGQEVPLARIFSQDPLASFTSANPVARLALENARVRQTVQTTTQALPICTG
jgi:hypothetical protein